MKHTLRIKWVAITLAVLAFARPVDAVTNDLNAAYKANIERAIGLINTGKTSWASHFLGEAARSINALGKSGDASLLPYLEEKSLNAANPEIVRRRAAAAYVNIANVDEGAEFMRKIFAINDNEGYWRDTIAPLFLQKVEAAIASRSISDETQTRVLSLLVAYAQSPANAQEAVYVDDFLVRRCDGYTNSIQRMSMANSFSDGLNDLEKKHFLPIRESVEALPKKQRTDLRKRFPDLPPLPEDTNAGMPLKTALVIGAALVACISGCLVIWIMAKRRKTQK